MEHHENRDGRATVPLSTLLDDAELETTLLSPAVADLEADPTLAKRIRETPVTSAIVNELGDPSPYLRADDMLLITGLALSDDLEETEAYVDRLQSVGASAIVFGAEPVHHDVPHALITSCRVRGLPLIGLPPHTYFAQIIARLNRAFESEHTRSLSMMNSLARRLTEAALRHHPAQSILSVLAQDTNGWAVLRIGTETFRAGILPVEIDPEETLAELEHRLPPHSHKQGGMPTAFLTVHAGGDLHELTAHRANEPRHSTRSAVLGLGRSPRLTSIDRTALMIAANLLGIIVQLPVEQSTAVDQLLMHLLIQASPQVNAHDRLPRLIAGSFGDHTTQVHAVVAVPSSSRDENAGVSDTLWLRQVLRTPFVEHRSQSLRAFVASPPTASDLQEAEELEWLLAISRAHPFDKLQEAMLEAEEFSRSARKFERHIEGHQPEKLESDWLTATGAEAALGKAAAKALLAPLDTPPHEEARQVLNSWLYHHGSWDRTARALGLHRNTVRRLISNSSRALNQDLTDPIVRARLTLAFAALDIDE